jgi:aspartate aminotransferase
MNENTQNLVGSTRIHKQMQLLGPVIKFFTDSYYTRLVDEPDICDFAVGNPQEMPLSAFVEALQKAVVPQNKDWFAYKDSETPAQEAAAASLSKLHGIHYQAADISMTNGAFAALTVALTAVIDPGDEVIFLSPPWFFYEALIQSAGGIPIRVKLEPPAFDLELEAVEAVLTENTRAIIINTPQNPSGRIYPPESLQELAGLLESRSRKNSRPIYLLADEAYNRIVYDGRTFTSPAAFYNSTLVLYTYGKTLLTPGQRLGYIALPPGFEKKKELLQSIFTAQLLTGYAFPNALLQHALPDLEKLSIDIDNLQNKRDRIVRALGEIGYQANTPQGTFYVLVRSPLEDDQAYAEKLSSRGVLVLPGSVFELPGYFRLSLTASSEMIDRSLPAFKDILDSVSRSE